MRNELFMYFLCICGTLGKRELVFVLIVHLFVSYAHVKIDLYDLVIFDHFWPSDWRENGNEF